MFVASLAKLDRWLEKKGWAGYDPYDIRGIKPFLYMQRNRYANYGSNFLLERYPMFFRKAFRIKKQVNAKGMGLFARAYLNLYKKTRDESYMRKALDCLGWLQKNPSKGYSSCSWGYPFDWQSRVFIPRGTPSSVVTSTVAHAFLDAYEILNDESFLNVAKSCNNFILNDLNIDKVSENAICFSYTPIDNFHVHNANLLSASVLLRSHVHFRESKYKEFGVKAMNYTVNHQNEDGSWYYWAPPDKLDHHVDNYHTGFVLECLNVARRALGEEFNYASELRKGLEFYADNLFLEDGEPKMFHDRLYPVDIHSCAQGIITFRELVDFEPKYLDLAERITEWTISNMQDEEGYFYYRIHKNQKVDRAGYIRWGQAWMLRALSHVV